MCIYGTFKDDLGFFVSKEGKIPNPKKIQAIVNMPPPKSVAKNAQKNEKKGGLRPLPSRAESWRPCYIS
jgi:hypothetical protein